MVSGTLNGMTLTIDRAGRIVVPKPVRARLGLHPGSELDVEETAAGLVIKPAAQKPVVRRSGRVLVYTGEVPPGYDLVRAIESDREERDRKVWGS